MARAIIRTVTANAITAGGPTQDFTVSGIGTPVAAAVYATRLDGAFGVDPQKKISVGFTDGTNQAGVAAQDQSGLSSTNCNTITFDDSLVRVPANAGSPDVAVGAFDSFITDGIRINWTTLPNSDYKIMVVLWVGDDLEVDVGTTVGTTTVGANVKVTTGFEPDHLMTAAYAAVAFDETYRRVFQLSLAHAINAAATMEGGTGAIVRGWHMRHNDDISTTAPIAVMLNDDLAVSTTGDSDPITFKPGTRLDPTTPWESDGFNVETSAGDGTSVTGPEIAYLAISYGGKKVSLDDYLTPTGTGTDKITLGFRPDSWLGFQTGVLSTEPDWGPREELHGQPATTGGPLAGHSAASEWCISLQADAAASTSDTWTRVEDDAFNLTNSSATYTTRYEATLSSFDVDGITFNWSQVSATARRFVLFVLQTDDVQGTSAMDLPGVEFDASGEESIPGTAALTLPAVVLAAAGSEEFTGTAALDLPSAELAAVGVESFVGSAALAMQAVAMVGTGVESFVGAAAMDLPAVVMAAAGAESMAGTAALALPAAELAAVGVESFVGAADMDLPAVEFAAAGLEAFTGTAALDLPSAAMRSTGLESFVGSAALTLPAIELDAAGTSVATGVAGSAALTLPAAAMAATGTVVLVITGTAALTLPAVDLNATGVESFVGSAALTLPAAELAATGVEAMTGAAALTLPAVEFAAVGVESFVGSAALTLPAVELDAMGTLSAANALTCAHDLLGSFQSRVALLGSFQSTKALAGSYDARADLRGSVC